MKHQKKYLSILTILSLLIWSCTNASDEKEGRGYLIKNNIDCLFGFNGSSNIVKGIAHSGIYFNKVDTTNRYSITFSKSIKELGNGNIGSMSATVWVSAKNLNCDAKFVVGTSNNGELTSWNGLHLKDVIKTPITWYPMKLEVDLTKINPNDILSVYVWNVGVEDVFVDDFEIEFFDKK